MTPEEKARQEIDAMLVASGWVVQTKDEMNLSTARGVVVCELSFTDLLIRDLLRGRVEGLVVAANNQDVTTFDNLVESTHYDLFSHVILVNAEKFGGSAVRAPYKNQWDRRIFDIHGSNLFAVNVCSLNLRDFRGPSLRQKKSKPAGFVIHP